MVERLGISNLLSWLSYQTQGSLRLLGVESIFLKEKDLSTACIPDDIMWNREQSSPPGPAQIANFSSKTNSIVITAQRFDVVYYITINNWYGFLVE